MTRLGGDGWAGLVLLLLSGICLAELLQEDATGAFVKTTTLPVALVLLLGALSLVLIAQSLRRPAGAAAKDAPSRAGAGRAVAVVAGTALYALAMPWIGYFAATALYIAALAFLFGQRGPIVLAALMLLVPAALMLFFEKYMIILLPDGRWLP